MVNRLTGSTQDEQSFEQFLHSLSQKKKVLGHMHNKILQTS